jgi:hypothetical protein
MLPDVGHRQVVAVTGIATIALLTTTGASGVARAADPAPGASSEQVALPPPSVRAYLQYGVALAAEAVASAGPICSNVSNCILGSGGGIAIRAGWRPTDHWYMGGAYEASKQDPNQLYRLGILQQVRFEVRRYFPTGKETTPFVQLGAGAHGYGNEWGIDTWGPNGTIGVGLEVELGGPALPVLALSLAYRPMYFQAWVDSSTLSHNAGVAHFVALEVSLEAKDTL